MPALSVLKSLCSKEVAPPTSFPPYLQGWVHTHSPTIVIEFFYLPGRGIIQCVGVSQLY